MKRRLFNLAAVVSLVMMLATLWLWVQSLFAEDVFLFVADASYGAKDAVGIGSSSSLMYLYHRVYQLRIATGFQHWVSEPGPLLNTPSWRAFALALDAGDPSWAVYVPHWFVALLFALPPGWKLFTILRSRKRGGESNLCIVCGYDLRATPERCPECGSAVAPKPAEAAA
jgi:hypothetical protein